MQNRPAAVDPGSLRDLIEFLVLPDTPTLDKFGAEQEAPTLAFKEYAAYQAVNSREFPEKYKMIAESTGRFLIRFRDNVLPDRYRISFSGKTYDITGTRELDSRRTHLYVEVRISE